MYPRAAAVMHVSCTKAYSRPIKESVILLNKAAKYNSCFVDILHTKDGGLLRLKTKIEHIETSFQLVRAQLPIEECSEKYANEEDLKKQITEFVDVLMDLIESHPMVYVLLDEIDIEVALLSGDEWFPMWLLICGNDVVMMKRAILEALDHAQKNSAE